MSGFLRWLYARRIFMRDGMMVGYGGLFMAGIHNARAGEPYVALFVAAVILIVGVAVLDATEDLRRRP